MDHLQLEKIKCNFCQQETPEKLILEKEGAYLKHKFSIVRCSECGLTYVNPRLSDGELEKLYNADYYHNKGWDMTADYVANLDNFELFWRKYRIGDLSKILYYKPRLKGIKFLDVGCALGNFMMFMQEQGAIVQGVEWSSFAVERDRKLGLNVKQGDIHKLDFPANSFDIVCAREVMEHLYDPLNFLKEVYRILKPGGLFYYSTGNIAASKDITNWEYIRPEGHIYYFSPKTMTNYFKKVGFRVLPRLVTFNYFLDYVSIGPHAQKKGLELLFKLKILSRNPNALRNIPILWAVWVIANLWLKKDSMPLAMK